MRLFITIATQNSTKTWFLLKFVVPLHFQSTLHYKPELAAAFLQMYNPIVILIHINGQAIETAVCVEYRFGIHIALQY